MNRKRITAVFGTRPEAIKMCPLIAELKGRKELDVRVCLTGQHGDMVKDTLKGFRVDYDVDLEIMTVGQTLFDITEKTMSRSRAEFSSFPPELVLVHGDTSSAFAASLSAFYMGIPIGHVEAGLRTGNVCSPFPEEFNRRSIDLVSRLCFCPTEENAKNLISEGKAPKACFITGNTVVDALKYTTKGIDRRGNDRPRVIITAHRRENLGKPMRSLLRGILRAAQMHPSAEFIFPVHPNPLVREAVREVFKGAPENIRLTEPMDVFSFHRLLATCDIIVTDSGGLQEEASALGIPLILARDTTERPEASMIISGTNEDSVFSAICDLLDSPLLREEISSLPCPFGDGSASKKIADAIVKASL